MSDTQVTSVSVSADPTPAAVALRFEAAVLPVSDVDRAKAFYRGLGWRQDADLTIDPGYRILQFTPPGSPASIQFGAGLTSRTPGTADGLYLIVEDIEAARADLASRGASVSEVWHGKGLGAEGHLPGPDPEGGSYKTFASFSDPDGNTFLLQQITERLPGR